MDAPTNVVDLRWEQVDLKNAILHVRRVKQGTPATSWTMWSPRAVRCIDARR